MNNNTSDETGFEFRPITGGLGFNKKTDLEEISLSKTKTKESKPASSRAFARSIQKNLQQDVRKTVPPVPRPKPLGVSSAAQVAPVVASTEQTVEKAINLFHKFFSWSVDTAVVLLTAMASTIAIEYFVTNNFSPEALTRVENWVYITGPLFSFYFVFYYSIFWKTTQKTLGMLFFGLVIGSKDSDEINLKQTFFRSMIAFMSMFTFGILDILGLPDTLTWTRVRKA